MFAKLFLSGFIFLSAEYTFFLGKPGIARQQAINFSYISKSEKDPPWSSYFWWGTAGQTQKGLKIFGIDLIDADEKDYISLETIQTQQIHFMNNIIIKK